MTADTPKTSLNHDKESVCALLTGTLVFPLVIGSMQQIKIISELKVYGKTSIKFFGAFLYPLDNEHANSSLSWYDANLKL